MHSVQCDGRLSEHEGSVGLNGLSETLQAVLSLQVIEIVPTVFVLLFKTMRSIVKWEFENVLSNLMKTLIVHPVLRYLCMHENLISV